MVTQIVIFPDDWNGSTEAEDEYTASAGVHRITPTLLASDVQSRPARSGSPAAVLMMLTDSSRHCSQTAESFGVMGNPGGRGPDALWVAVLMMLTLLAPEFAT
jgi:hypothetical protein